MASHAGAARFAYNAGLAHVKEALDNGEVWWSQNSKESYSGGLRDLAQGLSNWSKSRKG